MDSCDRYVWIAIFHYLSTAECLCVFQTCKMWKEWVDPVLTQKIAAANKPVPLPLPLNRPFFIGLILGKRKEMIRHLYCKNHLLWFAEKEKFGNNYQAGIGLHLPSGALKARARLFEYLGYSVVLIINRKSS